MCLHGVPHYAGQQAPIRLPARLKAARREFVVQRGVSETTAYSAVVPTPGQEGGWLQFPGPPVLPLKGMSIGAPNQASMGTGPRCDIRRPRAQRLGVAGCTSGAENPVAKGVAQRVPHTLSGWASPANWLCMPQPPGEYPEGCK